METDCPLIKKGYANYYLNNKDLMLCSLEKCPYHPDEKRQELKWKGEKAYICNSRGKILQSLDKKVKPIFIRLKEIA